MNTKGKFIVLEGNEGCGKSTQTKLLGEYLSTKNIPFYMTNEASDGPIGKIIRSEYLSGKRKADNRILNTLYVADRLDHITNEDDGMIYKINDGINVVSDRYYMSSAAYHSSFFYDDPEECKRAMIDILRMNEINMRLMIPDVTLYLKTSAELCYERVNKREDTSEIFDNLESIKKVSYCYDQAAGYLRSHGENIIIVDGNNSIDVVHNNIVGIINQIIGIGDPA